jgi:hypothetical protein
VADEIAMFEVVRAALSRRAGGEALAAIAAYRARFPRGTFSSEAVASEIEAIAITDPSRARALAQAFLSRNPRSLNAPRIRAAVGLPPPEAPP